MTSSTGSDDSASIEKCSYKDKNNNIIDVDEENTSSPNSNHAETLYDEFPEIQLIVDLPIYGPQLHPPLVSSEDGSTNNQAPKVVPEEDLEEKRKKEAQVGENVCVMDTRLLDMLSDGSHTSSLGGLIPHKRPIEMINASYNEKDQVPPRKDNNHPCQPLIGNRMRSYPNSLYSIDLPIHGPQLHPPLVSDKDGFTNDQAPMGEPDEVLEGKKNKEATQGREAAAAKPQKEAQVGENVRAMARILRHVFGDGTRASSRKRLSDIFGDGSRRSFVEGLIPPKQPIRTIKAANNSKNQVPAEIDIHPRQPLCGTKVDSNQNSYYSVSNKDGSTHDDQVSKAQPEAVLEDEANNEATQGREAAATKLQEEAQVQENIRVMAKRLRAVFGDGSRPYKPRKRLCDVFGDGSRASSGGGLIPHKQPIRTVNTAYNAKDQVPAGKDTHPPQPLCGNRMYSFQNSYYSRIPAIQLTVDLPIFSPMATTTQGREVVGDSIAEEQAAQVGEAAPNAAADSQSATRNDVVPMVEYHCPDSNLLPPEEDDEDYYN